MPVRPALTGKRACLRKLQRDYGYDRLNALLVLKDILSKVWKDGAPVPSQEAP